MVAQYRYESNDGHIIVRGFAWRNFHLKEHDDDMAGKGRKDGGNSGGKRRDAGRVGGDGIVHMGAYFKPWFRAIVRRRLTDDEAWRLFKRMNPTERMKFLASCDPQKIEHSGDIFEPVRDAMKSMSEEQLRKIVATGKMIAVMPAPAPVRVKPEREPKPKKPTLKDELQKVVAPHLKANTKGKKKK